MVSRCFVRRDCKHSDRETTSKKQVGSDANSRQCYIQHIGYIYYKAILIETRNSRHTYHGECRSDCCCHSSIAFCTIHANINAALYSQETVVHIHAIIYIESRKENKILYRYIYEIAVMCVWRVFFLYTLIFTSDNVDNYYTHEQNIRRIFPNDFCK